MGKCAVMHALFEEAGKFLAGRILSEAESSAQVELDSGKRVKVKAANILLKFEKPAPAELMAQGLALATEIASGNRAVEEVARTHGVSWPTAHRALVAAAARWLPPARAALGSPGRATGCGSPH